MSASLVPDAATDTAGVVHTLAVRGILPDLPAGAGHLVESGLVARTPDGYVLTNVGYRCHRALVEQVLTVVDVEALAIHYAPLPELTRRASALTDAGLRAPETAAGKTSILELTELIGRLTRVVASGVRAAPRFGDYLPRLEASGAALRRPANAAELAVLCESAGALCRELREDCLQTLGLGAEPEEY